MSVYFSELAGSPVEEYGPDGMKARREFVVDWSDRNEFIRELLGDGYAFAGTGQTQYPNKTGVLVVNAKVRPFTSDIVSRCHDDIELDLNSYTSLAVVEVHYDSVDPTKWPDPEVLPGDRPDPQCWLTYRVTFGVECMAIEGRGLKWESTSPGDDAVPIAEADLSVIQQIPIIEHHLTFHRVQNPPFTAIRDKIGCVNQDPDNPIKGIYPETLLFCGANLDREFIIPYEFDELKCAWRLEYLFKEKRIVIPQWNLTFGWNHQYRTVPKADEGWSRVKTRYGSIYPPVDFLPLFQPEVGT